MPKDPKFVIKLISSRNRFPLSNQIIQWINESNSGDNLKQYEACKTDEEVADVVRMDAKKKGLVEAKHDTP